jgi:hypothetical protein
MWEFAQIGGLALDRGVEKRPPGAVSITGIAGGDGSAPDLFCLLCWLDVCGWAILSFACGLRGLQEKVIWMA